MLQKQFLVNFGLVVFSIGLFILLRGFLLEAPLALSADEIVENVIAQLEKTPKGQYRLSFSQKYSAVSSLELYHPDPAGAEFSKLPLHFLRSISKYSRNCDESTYRTIRDTASTDRLAKAIEWQKTLCTKKSGEFSVWLKKTPLMHSSGISYAKLFIAHFPHSNFAKNDNGRFHHVFERPAHDRFDRWYLKLSADQKMHYLFGAKIVLGVDGVAINFGWDGTKQTISIIEPEMFFALLKSQYKHTAIELDRAEACAFVREEICFNHVDPTAKHGIQKLVNETSIAAVTSVVVFVFLVFGFYLRRGKLEKRKLAEAHAFVFRVISHEIRTPMTSIQLYLDSLRRQYDSLTPKGQQDLMKLLETFSELNRVIDKSLEELRGSTQTHSCELYSIVENVIEKEYQNLVKFKTSVESARVPCSQFWAEIFVKNLINNALKHGQGDVMVSLKKHDGVVELQVKDQGQVPIKQLRAHLKPFSKGQDSDGLGFGLSMVKQKTEEFGGQLIVEAQPTRYIIRFNEKRPTG